MKSCSEMTSSVFSRIEEYKKKKEKRRRLIAKAVLPVLGICLAVLIGGVYLAQEKYKPAEESAVNSEIEYSGENVIVINKIDGVSANRMYICLLLEDFVPMNKKELNEYFGIDVFPDVPSDMKEWDIENDSANYGIFRRNGGTGEVYHDGIVINYSNKDLSRNINIELAKGKYPYSCSTDFELCCEKSVIRGTEAVIGQSETGDYFIEFMYRNVGFHIIINGLSIEEIENVIESIVS